MMLLFYSDHCPFCRSLLEALNKKDTDKEVRLVSIDNLKAKGKQIPSQIHSVPALFIPETQTVIHGKNVFDFLISAETGYFVRKERMNNANMNMNNANNANTNNANNANANANVTDPQALFSMESNFANFDDGMFEDNQLNRQFELSKIDETAATHLNDKKDLPNLDNLINMRATDIVRYTNTAQMPPVVMNKRH